MFACRRHGLPSSNDCEARREPIRISAEISSVEIAASRVLVGEREGVNSPCDCSDNAPSPGAQPCPVLSSQGVRAQSAGDDLVSWPMVLQRLFHRQQSRSFVAFVIHGTPQINHLPVELHIHFIKVPPPVTKALHVLRTLAANVGCSTKAALFRGKCRCRARTADTPHSAAPTGTEHT